MAQEDEREFNFFVMDKIQALEILINDLTAEEFEILMKKLNDSSAEQVDICECPESTEAYKDGYGVWRCHECNKPI